MQGNTAVSYKFYYKLLVRRHLFSLSVAVSSVKFSIGVHRFSKNLGAISRFCWIEHVASNVAVKLHQCLWWCY